MNRILKALLAAGIITMVFVGFFALRSSTLPPEVARPRASVALEVDEIIDVTDEHVDVVGIVGADSVTTWDDGCDRWFVFARLRRDGTLDRARVADHDRMRRWCARSVHSVVSTDDRVVVNVAVAHSNAEPLFPSDTAGPSVDVSSLALEFGGAPLDAGSAMRVGSERADGRIRQKVLEQVADKHLEAVGDLVLDVHTAERTAYVLVSQDDVEDFEEEEQDLLYVLALRRDDLTLDDRFGRDGVTRVTGFTAPVIPWNLGGHEGYSGVASALRPDGGVVLAAVGARHDQPVTVVSIDASGDIVSSVEIALSTDREDCSIDDVFVDDGGALLLAHCGTLYAIGDSGEARPISAGVTFGDLCRRAEDNDACSGSR